MDFRTLIEQAKSKIVLDHPFYASILLQQEMIECETLPSGRSLWMAATDGLKIYVNPKNMVEIPLEQVCGILVHEIQHTAHMHPLRKGNRDHRKWNKAGDYAINPIILDHTKYGLPDGILNSPRYKDKCAEEIYPQLADEPEDNGAGNGRGWNIGDIIEPVDGDGNPVSKKVKEEIEEQIKGMIARAIQVAKSCGKVPAGMERLLTELTKPKLTWREILLRFATETIRDDYSWQRPNPKYVPFGFYIPDLRNEGIADVAFMLDMSGSIGQNEANFMGSELQGALSTYQQEKEILVIYIDSAVAGHEWLNTSDIPCKLHPKGGGGTSFKPGFEWLEGEGIEPKAVFYLTDGYCSSFPNDPGYPVLWILTENAKKNFKPPFGEVIYIDFKKEGVR